jgi:hypothetical protein
MVDIEKLKTEIDQMLRLLSPPLSTGEISYGWNEKMREWWIDYFTRIKNKLVAGTPIDPNESNAGYGISMQGVEEGPLSDHITSIGVKLLRLTGRIKDE